MKTEFKYKYQSQTEKAYEFLTKYSDILNKEFAKKSKEAYVKHCVNDSFTPYLSFRILNILSDSNIEIFKVVISSNTLLYKGGSDKHECIISTEIENYEEELSENVEKLMSEDDICKKISYFIAE